MWQPPDRSTIQVQQFTRGWSYKRPDGSWSKQLSLGTALVLRPRGIV